MEVDYTDTIKDAVAKFETAYIRHHLKACHHSRTKTANALGISRTALFQKMRRYKIGGMEKKEPIGSVYTRCISCGCTVELKASEVGHVINCINCATKLNSNPRKS